MDAADDQVSGRSGSLQIPLEAGAFARILLGWYDQNRRTLPWRDNRDSYRIWVSEIMLQQTQISTALPYYRKFIREYPTLETLARAEEAEVLSNWSGLGYYSRARNLHAAARLVCENFSGQFPSDFQQALSLPGIGRYTAGAILSIAYGLPLPVLDGNVKRFLTRYLCIQHQNIGRDEKKFWSLLSELVKHPAISGRVGDFNQGLMELGSQVCTPRKPGCDVCPVSGTCKALEAGLEKSLPRPVKRRSVEKLEYTVALMRRQRTYLLTQQPKGDLLAGFWDFPRIAGAPDTDLAHRFQIQLGLKLELQGQLKSLSHQITYRKLTFHPVLARLKGRPPEGYLWTMPGRKGYPVPGYVNKILKRSF